MLRLIRKEGLPSAFLHQDLVDAFVHFETRKEYRQAAKWARRAADSVRESAGADAPTHAQFMELETLMNAAAGFDVRKYEF